MSQDWRAGAASTAPASLPRADVDHEPDRRRYASPNPAILKTLNLGALLPPWRPVTEQQQTRLGFRDADGSLVWCAGDTTLAQRRCVAIVGTRNVSADGASRARRLARELAEAGVVIVSGLAKGVDTCALTSAIEARGRVIAVIGTPITQAYPAENKRLQELIYRDHLLVSQFAPGERVFKTNFPARNKLMAALSDATVIVEASDTSGTLHQAAECVRLGRWLFICRSLLDAKGVTWPREFLRNPDRTRVLTTTADVLEALAGIRAAESPA